LVDLVGFWRIQKNGKIQTERSYGYNFGKFRKTEKFKIYKKTHI